MVGTNQGGVGPKEVIMEQLNDFIRRYRERIAALLEAEQRLSKERVKALIESAITDVLIGADQRPEEAPDVGAPLKEEF